VRAALLAAVVLGALAAAGTSSAATRECQGLNPCVPVAGPWVVVPTSKSLPRPQVQYQLTCPKGFVVAGLDAELSDQAIDLSFLGASGAPVSPGVTTSQTVVFVASYVGTTPKAPTFRPHAGCVPASGGGSRTPTAYHAIVPPGHPTIRRVKTRRVAVEDSMIVSCRPDERLVDWHLARAFATPAPPDPALVATLHVRGQAAGRQVVVDIQALHGQGIVQVAAVCAGGK
jgi:hypothetical protein